MTFASMFQRLSGQESDLLWLQTSSCLHADCEALRKVEGAHPASFGANIALLTGNFFSAPALKAVQLSAGTEFASLAVLITAH